MCIRDSNDCRRNDWNFIFNKNNVYYLFGGIQIILILSLIHICRFLKADSFISEPLLQVFCNKESDLQPADNSDEWCQWTGCSIWTVPILHR